MFLMKAAKKRGSSNPVRRSPFPDIDQDALDDALDLCQVFGNLGSIQSACLQDQTSPMRRVPVVQAAHFAGCLDHCGEEWVP